MYEDEYGDEMEYEEDMADDAEDNISDEDEDIEGMGHIEGLPGDHAMDVEVIMEEEDDDEDDDESGSDEDDEEDDDGRVEIIDEAGDIQHLAEDDDLDEWESDDGHDEGDEEEDYEGHAQDEDEVHLHQGLDVGHMVDGPLGDLVRALGGGEGAVDILERMEEQMEAEGLDPDDEDRMGGDYMEDGEGDGKSPLCMRLAWC
jgi:E3 ubiquitin-protein ligase HUWE1